MLFRSHYIDESRVFHTPNINDYGIKESIITDIPNPLSTDDYYPLQATYQSIISIPDVPYLNVDLYYSTSYSGRIFMWMGNHPDYGPYDESAEGAITEEMGAPNNYNSIYGFGYDNYIVNDIEIQNVNYLHLTIPGDTLTTLFYFNVYIYPDDDYTLQEIYNIYEFIIYLYIFL